jgi:hypothetical protein
MLMRLAITNLKVGLITLFRFLNGRRLLCCKSLDCHTGNIESSRRVSCGY